MNASTGWSRSSKGYKCCWAPSPRRGVLPLEFKPAYSVGDLLLQHLDALEQGVEEKGGVQQMLGDHFAKVYKVSMRLAA
jgi:hypothetical protein